MIKGVNKRIIEINHPESPYFERAVFYLKPNVRELPSAISEREIQKYINRLGYDDYCVKRSNRLRNLFITIAIVGSSVGIILAFIN